MFQIPCFAIQTLAKMAARAVPHRVDSHVGAHMDTQGTTVRGVSIPQCQARLHIKK